MRYKSQLSTNNILMLHCSVVLMIRVLQDNIVKMVYVLIFRLKNPTNVKAESLLWNRVKISWQPGKFLTDYVITRRRINGTDVPFQSGTLGQGDPLRTNYQDSLVYPSIKYVYRVLSHKDNVGNSSGVDSNEVTTSILPSHSGNLLSGTFGSFDRGVMNFEMLVLQGDKIVHYSVSPINSPGPVWNPWYNGAELPSLASTSPGAAQSVPTAVSFIQSNFNDPGNFEVVARMTLLFNAGG
jgi:hypothetical protein